MGRGPVVEKKKNQSNALRQKAFSIHAKLISIAAEKGGDPDKNPSLCDAIEKARKDNVPNENILRAIKKGTGEDKSATQITQIIYEGYGPGGVAIIVSTLTDNKNRTAPNIRHIFSKYGGNMGEPGSVSFIFERKGILAIDLENYSSESLEELVFETDVEDFWQEDGMFKIITSIDSFVKVKKFFEAKNINSEFADIDYIPSTIVEVDDFDKALKLTKMIEAFNEDEDVEKISVNMNISDKLQKEVDDFIDKNTFRT
ncbi:MAG: YebC/PmpR family DNA-binding transcriptional regulator [Candidatus Gracilibacteria bacterium]|nr:YebC/PmpR family DNA-binding transcriptional regulator [Candidatus Gracilibacteria bacterium]